MYLVRHEEGRRQVRTRSRWDCHIRVPAKMQTSDTYIHWDQVRQRILHRKRFWRRGQTITGFSSMYVSAVGHERVDFSRVSGRVGFFITHHFGFRVFYLGGFGFDSGNEFRTTIWLNFKIKSCESDFSLNFRSKTYFQSNFTKKSKFKTKYS